LTRKTNPKQIDQEMQNQAPTSSNKKILQTASPKLFGEEVFAE